MELEFTLRHAIETCGKTVNQLARDTGIPQQVLQRFVSMERRNLRLDTMQKLCGTLGLVLNKKETVTTEKLGRIQTKVSDLRDVIYSDKFDVPPLVDIRLRREIREIQTLLRELFS